MLSGTLGDIRPQCHPISELCIEAKRTSHLPAFSEPARGGLGQGQRSLLGPPGHPRTVFIRSRVTEQEKLVLESEEAGLQAGQPCPCLCPCQPGPPGPVPPPEGLVGVRPAAQAP